MSQMTSTARVGARALTRPPAETPRLRVVTGAPLRHGGAAFGAICAVLLAAGLVGLLLLNTSMAQGSFTLSRLQATSDQLGDTQDALNQSLDAAKAPANLAKRAVSMGMVPADSAAFLRLSDGKVIGVAKPASSDHPLTVGVTSASVPPAVVAQPAKKPPAVVVKKAGAASATSAMTPASTAASAAAKAPKPAKR